MSNSRLIRSPVFSILTISPLRRVTISMILLEYSSGTLIVNSSIGSHLTPSISLKITCGWPTWSSYPSRRIVSISTERWSTPRPETIHLPSSSLFFTRRAKFLSSSFIKRSWIWREVTNLPSLPKNGESLMVNNILMVGSSIAIGGKASGFSKSQTVSPISNPSIPTNAQISPDETSVVFTRPRPSKTWSSLILVLNISPLRFTSVTFIPSFKVPRCTRPTAIRPV